MIADHDLKKAICPGCFTEVRIDVLFEERTSWHDINVDGSDRYWVLKCRGCDGIFFGHGYSFSENTDYLLNENTGEWHLEYVEEKTFYPRALKRNKPEWFDRRFSIDNSEIYAILYEVYSALDHELFSVGAMGIRTVFDLLAIKLGTLTSCSIPDDHIDPRRSAFFMAKSILRDIRSGVRTC